MILPFIFSILIAGTRVSAGGGEPAVQPSINKTVFLQMVNAVRKTGCKCGDTWYPAAPSLSWNEQLEKAAYGHSRDMSENKYFSHDGRDGSDPGDRITKAGYSWKTYAENIGQGYDNEQSVLNGWLKSPGHCRNLMNAKYREVGAARAGGYWTMNLATK